jgi:hypothetical protein
MLRNRKSALAAAPSEPAPSITVDEQIAELKRQAKAANEDADRLEKELQTFPERLAEAKARYTVKLFDELSAEQLRVFRQLKAARIEALRCQVEIRQLNEPVFKEQLDRLRVAFEELEKRSKQAKVDFLSASFSYSGNISSKIAYENQIVDVQRLKLPRVEPLDDEYEDFDNAA